MAGEEDTAKEHEQACGGTDVNVLGEGTEPARQAAVGGGMMAWSTPWPGDEGLATLIVSREPAFVHHAVMAAMLWDFSRKVQGEANPRISTEIRWYH